MVSKIITGILTLKLRNTSYFHWRVEEEDGDSEDSLLHFIEAVGNLDIKKVQPIKNKENKIIKLRKKKMMWSGILASGKEWNGNNK